MSLKERGKDGRFISNIRENVEDAYNIFSIITRMLPMAFILLFALNYFGAWGILKKYGDMFVNIGDPNCKLVCDRVDMVD